MAQVKKVTKIKKTAISLEEFNNLNQSDAIVDDKKKPWLVVEMEPLLTLDAHQTLKSPYSSATLNVIWYCGQMLDVDRRLIPELNTGKEKIKLAN